MTTKTKKPKRNIWEDESSPYGTYIGEAGNQEQWKKSFEFVKMSKSQASCIIQTESPYTILGIEIGANEETIKSAMRKLAVANHPDKGGDREKFEKVIAAYTILTTTEN